MNRTVVSYSWLILKNVIGWVLILAAWPVGLLLPGPGGIPLFIIGFGLITFPGKRRLTARVLRGKPFSLRERPVMVTRVMVSLVLASAVVWYVDLKHDAWFERARHGALVSLLFAAAVMAGTWGLTRLAVPGGNWLLRVVPVIRRRVRPWMRRHGIDLLPPRRRRRLRARASSAIVGGAAHVEEALAAERIIDDADQDGTIVEIGEHHQRKVARLKERLVGSWPVIKRVLGIVLMAAIFVWMIRPIVRDWDKVQPFIRKTHLGTFVAACGIFATFLFARALAWRRILMGFGHELPLWPAVRIWISSELARYVPGSVLQFAGRVYLAKPYGVPRAVTITSQILELCAFLLGNVIVAVGCLLFFMTKMDGRAKGWFLLALVLLPTLSLVLHPKVFYGVTNWFRVKRGKDPIVVRLRGKVLTFLLGAAVVALVYQSLAIWLLTHRALDLEIAHWWYVAGAYCLAWIAGFLSFLSPGGLGVREVVLYLALKAILPAHIKDELVGKNREVLNAYLLFLPLLLRLWTIVGELMVWGLATVMDWKGATGRPDAPGRVWPFTGETPPGLPSSAPSPGVVAAEARPGARPGPEGPPPAPPAGAPATAGAIRS